MDIPLAHSMNRICVINRMLSNLLPLCTTQVQQHALACESAFGMPRGMVVEEKRTPKLPSLY